MSESTEKSQNSHNLFNRLENIKKKLFLTWDGLAEKMDCDRSLFFQVKRGNCGFSLNNLRKLQELERAAGIEIASEFKKSVEESGFLEGKDGIKVEFVHDFPPTSPQILLADALHEIADLKEKVVSLERKLQRIKL